jgi:hypothetical protein
MTKKPITFRLDPLKPCPCGSKKPLAQCCLLFDGTLYKKRSVIQPPGIQSGNSHPRCYLNFTKNCGTKITREHWISNDIFREIGAVINVEGLPWLQPGETRQLPAPSLASNILCDRHNAAFSGLDTTAGRLFTWLDNINEDLAHRSLSRKKQLYILSGEDLEMWAAKMLLGILHSQPKDSALSQYSVDNVIVQRLIATSILPTGCGLYLDAREGLQKRHTNKRIQIGPITINRQKRLIGLQIEMVGLSFYFFMDSLGVDFKFERENKMYRPLALNFLGQNRSHHIQLSWPPDPIRRHMTFKVVP